MIINEFLVDIFFNKFNNNFILTRVRFKKNKLQIKMNILIEFQKRITIKVELKQFYSLIILILMRYHRIINHNDRIFLRIILMNKVKINFKDQRIY